MRLRECGYRQMTAYRLKNHNIIMSHSVLFNKCYNYLPCELNIFENIALIAGIKLTADKSFVYEERMPMKDVHLAATKIFLKQRLNLTDHVVTKLIRQFPSLKERSINNIRQTIDLLENKFGFPLDRIAQSYLLIANTSTLRKLDEMQEVYGVDVRSIVSNAPQIVRADISNIIGIKNLLHLYKVPSYAAAYWKRIFTMHPKTLTANMIELDQFDLPFNPFEHPAILKLAQHLNSIQNQLDSHNNSGKTDRITLEKFIEWVGGGGGVACIESTWTSVAASLINCFLLFSYPFAQILFVSLHNSNIDGDIDSAFIGTKWRGDEITVS